MKRYLKNFTFTQEFVESSIIECMSRNTGKIKRWCRMDTAYFLAECLEKGGFVRSGSRRKTAIAVANSMPEYIWWYEENLVPFIAKSIISDITSRSLSFQPIKTRTRIDASSKKEREIGITSIKQQICDYIAVNALAPMLYAKIGQYQCSCIKGRGQHLAKKYIEKWLRQKHRRTRYVSKFDIRKCYPSIRHDILFRLIERDVKNPDAVYLVETLISTYSKDGVGLCIGTYLSQFMSNYFLSYAYHFISEQAFKIRKERRNGASRKRVRLITKCIFYADDIALFSSDRRNLKIATRMMAKYLGTNLGLDLKNGTYQIIDMSRDGAFLDMVGFKFYKDHTTIRKRIYRRICHDIKAIRNGLRHHCVDLMTCKSFMSRHGFVKHSDSVKFIRKSKYNHIYDIAREMISNEAISVLPRATA